MWFSINRDLSKDARRDLNDIDAEDIPLKVLRGPYEPIQFPEGTGVLSLIPAVF